jgi:hypothetical protein
MPIAGRATTGLKYLEPGQAEFTLFIFSDDKTLAKYDTTRRKVSVSGELTGKPVHTEVYYSDFKITDGIKFPYHTSTFYDGKKVSESTFTRLEFLDTVDDSLFDRP